MTVAKYLFFVSISMMAFVLPAYPQSTKRNIKPHDMPKKSAKVIAEYILEKLKEDTCFAEQYSFSSDYKYFRYGFGRGITENTMHEIPLEDCNVYIEDQRNSQSYPGFVIRLKMKPGKYAIGRDRDGSSGPDGLGIHDIGYPTMNYELLEKIRKAFVDLISIQKPKRELY